MTEIKNVRITFPDMPHFCVEEMSDTNIKMSGRIKETTPEPVESWARRAFFATSHKDAVPVDIESRRFMVLEHESRTSPQLAFYQRGYAEQITRDAQISLKLMMGGTYGRFGKSRAIEELYRVRKEAAALGNRMHESIAKRNINETYGKYATQFPITPTPETIAWFKTIFPDYKPPYMGPLVTDLWTSAAYPLGVPERRWNYYDETPEMITPDVFERYCLRDLEISRHHFEQSKLSKPARHPRGKY